MPASKHLQRLTVGRRAASVRDGGAADSLKLPIADQLSPAAGVQMWLHNVSHSDIVEATKEVTDLDNMQPFRPRTLGGPETRQAANELVGVAADVTDHRRSTYSDRSTRSV